MSYLKPDKTLIIEPLHDAFNYQREACLAIRDLEYAAVFHEQGLGKTKIAIDILLYWLKRSIVDTVIIVAKKGLLYNWIRELAFHTHIKPLQLTQSKKRNYGVFNSGTRLVLAHFEVLKAEEPRIELFCKSRDVGVIIDESAKIKNPSSSLAESFLRLGPFFKRRIIMTGTPVANRPHDIWSQIYFLDQGNSLGGDFSEFKRGVRLSKELHENAEAQLDLEKQLDSL